MANRTPRKKVIAAAQYQVVCDGVTSVPIPNLEAARIAAKAEVAKTGVKAEIQRVELCFGREVITDRIHVGVEE